MYRIGPHKINWLIMYLVYVVYDLLGASYKNINWTATSLPKTLAGEGRQHTFLPNFPKNCMKFLKNWAVRGPPLDPPMVFRFEKVV